MFKKFLIAPVFTPLIVMIIYCLPRKLLPISPKFVPLHSSAKDIQDVIKNLVVRYVWLAALSLRKTRLNQSIKLV